MKGRLRGGGQLSPAGITSDQFGECESHVFRESRDGREMLLLMLLMLLMLPMLLLLLLANVRPRVISSALNESIGQCHLPPSDKCHGNYASTIESP
jgi:hypothetical protein